MRSFPEIFVSKMCTTNQYIQITILIKITAKNMKKEAKTLCLHISINARTGLEIVMSSDKKNIRI